MYLKIKQELHEQMSLGDRANLFMKQFPRGRGSLAQDWLRTLDDASLLRIEGVASHGSSQMKEISFIAMLFMMHEVTSSRGDEVFQTIEVCSARLSNAAYLERLQRLGWIVRMESVGLLVDVPWKAIQATELGESRFGLALERQDTTDFAMADACVGGVRNTH